MEMVRLASATIQGILVSIEDGQWVDNFAGFAPAETVVVIAGTRPKIAARKRQVI
jgi:hypothetical protein